MPSWLLVYGRGSEAISMSPGATRYFRACSAMVMVNLEVRVQFIARDSYTLKNLYVRVPANTLNGATTFKSRKNGANGNQSVSIGAGATGVFEDVVNSDNLVSGDLFNSQGIAGGAAGLITFTVISFILQTAANNTPIHGNRTGVAINFGETKYAPVGGVSIPSFTESDTQYIFRTSSTLSNLYTMVATNTLNGATTIRTRKNGANGNQSVSIGAGATGTFEDAVNTDNIAPGDTVNIQIVVGGAAGSLTPFFYELKSTSTARQIMAAYVDATPIAFGTTAFSCLEDDTDYFGVTESSSQVESRIPCRLKNEFVRVIANTLDGSTTLGLRKNGANTALSVSIPAATTGTFEDSDNVPVAVDDLLNSKIVTGGTVGTITVTIAGFEQLQPWTGKVSGVTNPAKVMGVDVGGIDSVKGVA